ncbi:MAG: hypothetical protein B7X11_02160, partial [Acidobacteria bacterium 37-65-4]
MLHIHALIFFMVLELLVVFAVLWTVWFFKARKLTRQLGAAKARLAKPQTEANAAAYFANGLKGRAEEEKWTEHRVVEDIYTLDAVESGGVRKIDVPMRNAMNEVLRDWYVDDCQGGVGRWNKILEEHGLSDRLKLPDRKFNRGIGQYAGFHFDHRSCRRILAGIFQEIGEGLLDELRIDMQERQIARDAHPEFALATELFYLVPRRNQEVIQGHPVLLEFEPARLQGGHVQYALHHARHLLRLAADVVDEGVPLFQGK